MKVVVEVDFSPFFVRSYRGVFNFFWFLVTRTRRMQRHVYLGDWGDRTRNFVAEE